jgi:uncharacterized protein YbjT (DUF2867 family)
MSQKRILIIGATGMVGGDALKICLEHPEVGEVTVVGRRATGINHEKLTEVIHDDFNDYSAVSESLSGQDVALFCLGAYTGAVPDDQFRQITVDFTVAFAEVLYRKSPEATVCFLSGAGADQSEKSRVSFARYKGAAEKALLAAGFPQVAIFRPGYIYPVTPRKEPNMVYRISRALYPVLRRIYPNIGISSEDLAYAMVNVGLDKQAWTGSPVLENRDIRTVAGR